MDRFVIRVPKVTQVEDQTAIREAPSKFSSKPHQADEKTKELCLLDNIYFCFPSDYSGEFVSRTKHEWLEQSTQLFSNKAMTKASCQISFCSICKDGDFSIKKLRYLCLYIDLH